MIKRINTKKTRLIIALIAIAMYIIMTLLLLLNLQKEYILDLKFFYSGDFFLNNFVGISDNQTKQYLLFHLFDYVFIITFYPLLSLILEKRLISLKYLSLVPIIAMLFDLIENILIDIQLRFGISEIFASFSGISTLLKFSLIGTSIIIYIYSYFQRRNKYEKSNFSGTSNEKIDS